MKRKLAPTFAFLTAGWLAIWLVWPFVSASGREAGDAGLPEPVTEDHFDELMKRSPFVRSLNLSDSILLTGVAHIDGKPVATLFDTESRESYVVSETPNSQGWKMVEINTDSDLEKVAVTISVAGGEVLTVRFDENQLKPGEGKPAGAAVPPTPRGPDSRPLPNDDDRRRFGEYVKKRMSAMTDAQKQQAGQIMQEKMKANPKMSDRQKGEVFMQILNYVSPEKR